jgi:RNA polymerase sigma-70 factor (ECF subfamily)
MPGQPEEEAQLLKKASQGEAEAFGYLYELHAAAIFRYLYVHLGNHADAEDLTSDVFLRAWQALPRYHQRGVPFRAFLFRIAHNAMVDHYRHVRIHSRLALERENTPAVEHPDPAEILTNKIDQQELVGVLSKLRDDYRTVLALRFISQLSPAETALVMQRSTGAVRVLQHRALEAVRQIVEGNKSNKV